MEQTAAKLSGAEAACYHTCEYNILKTNEPILMPIGKSGPWGEDTKQSTSAVRSWNVTRLKIHKETWWKYHSRPL